MISRIMAVDDEPSITRIIRLNLEATRKYQVREVNDPAQAIAAAREFRPHLVLLDIMMPGMDGSELAADFLSDDKLQHIPLVFLTALATNVDVISDHNWFVSGGRMFVPKPVDREVLVRCIEQRLSEHNAVFCA